MPGLDCKGDAVVRLLDQVLTPGRRWDDDRALQFAEEVLDAQVCVAPRSARFPSHKERGIERGSHVYIAFRSESAAATGSSSMAHPPPAVFSLVKASNTLSFES